MLMTSPLSPVRTAPAFVLWVAAALALAIFSPASASASALVPMTVGQPLIGAPRHVHIAPWVEGVDPGLESTLFAATYRALPAHNVLKVYAFSAGGYESAGIRFSARVPHEARDLTEPEIASEVVTLIHVTFDDFPSVQEVDIWGTVPVAIAKMTAVENTVFSISADRETYSQVRNQRGLSNDFFLGAFGRVWFAPQVPR
jgi:hypothetical protein